MNGGWPGMCSGGDHGGPGRRDPAGSDSYRVQLNLPSVLEPRRDGPGAGRLRGAGPAGSTHAIVRVPGLQELPLEELRPGAGASSRSRLFQGSQR